MNEHGDRPIYLSEKDAIRLKDLGLRLSHTDPEEAAFLLALSLAWRLAKAPVFACDIDESGGLAELYEFDNYSRKVPCA